MRIRQWGVKKVDMRTATFDDFCQMADILLTALAYVARDFKVIASTEDSERVK